MQRLVQEMTERLQSFLGSDEGLLLLLQCRDEDSALAFKILESIDETSADVFWYFREDFKEAQAYVASVIESFRARAEILTKKLEESAPPSPPWPPLPAQTMEKTTAPAARLQLLVNYLRARIADLGTSRLVVVLVPLHISEPLQWRTFLRDLTSFDASNLNPWCEHVRLITREPKDVSMEDLSPELQAELDPATFPGTEIYPIDFSMDALQKATEDEIANTDLPLEDRMRSLFMSANYDYAHKRYLEAGEKYQLLRQYYAATKNQTLLAATLNGLGEVHAATSPNLRDNAVDYFEMAITPAVEAKSYPVLLNVTLNLANLYLAHKEWAAAAEHYAAAEALATSLLNANVKLHCLENLGVCRHELEEWGPADKAWRDGVTLAHALEEHDTQKRLLMRLRAMYEMARMHDRVTAIDYELRGLP